MDDTLIGQRHICRVDISRGDDNVGNLGEIGHRFGFRGTGKFSNSGNYSTYAESFDIRDTILCVIDLESEPMGSIGFAKNGKWLGTAFGFGGTGKLSNSGNYSTYAESFVIRDTILCVIDLESEPMDSIGFAKNGKWLGTASCLINVWFGCLPTCSFEKCCGSVIVQL